MSQSRPARIADQIEALDGWAVERQKEKNTRTVIARRKDETVVMIFDRNRNGFDVFLEGFHWRGEDAEPFVNVAGKLRELAAPPAVPFALDADGDEIVAACLGKTVTWRSALTGKADSATVPTTAKHVRVWAYEKTGERNLTFPDLGGGGFRTVRLSAIESVS